MRKIIQFFIVLWLCLIFQPQALADLNEGLVAYYPFNGNANDESGNGNHGIVNGATLAPDMANLRSVYYNDFENGSTVGLSGFVNIEPTEGYSSFGFGNQFLRNNSGGWYNGGSTGTAGTPTSLTLTDLVEHRSIDIKYLFAVIDSCDGIYHPTASPDFFNVSVDGMLIFREPLRNWMGEGHFGTGTLIGTGHLGFTSYYGDEAYDMGTDQAFINVPHSSSTLTISWWADGAGWQGDYDESWGIDNLEIILKGVDLICDQNSNHCYQRFDDTMSWHMAKTHCENEGGYLVTITSQEEQDFVFDNLIFDSPQNCWVDATDEAEEGNWQWSNGEKWTYENWDSNEPNNCSGIEHYAVSITSDGSWQDRATLNNGSCGCDCPDDFEPMSTICEWGDIPGDLNGDNKVNEEDYQELRKSLGKCAGQSGFNSNADYDDDGCVSYSDYRIWYFSYYMD
jgi:hypothetical protein